MYSSKEARSLQFFSKYRLYLLALNTKKTERSRILADIHSGYIARDLLDSDWQDRLDAEIEELKGRLEHIEFAVEGVPDTSELIPCKLFLRLHYIVGLNMTETAEKLNVSLTTLRRIKARCISYFEDHPPFQ